MAYRKKNPPNPPLNRCIDCGCPIPISRVRQLCKDCDVQKSSDSFDRAWNLAKEGDEPPKFRPLKRRNRGGVSGMIAGKGMGQRAVDLVDQIMSDGKARTIKEILDECYEQRPERATRMVPTTSELQGMMRNQKYSNYTYQNVGMHPHQNKPMYQITVEPQEVSEQPPEAYESTANPDDAFARDKRYKINQDSIEIMQGLREQGHSYASIARIMSESHNTPISGGTALYWLNAEQRAKQREKNAKRRVIPGTLEYANKIVRDQEKRRENWENDPDMKLRHGIQSALDETRSQRHTLGDMTMDEAKRRMSSLVRPNAKLDDLLESDEENTE